ncbi:PAS domain S-box protein [Candidatus Obscuribacterales bacterium]|nr:PAS domain S-box protein [Candidatus Obscuribacterales bacterium]MBX3154133.1 PAS domain S-box protein [Candidatus Obscuribacterales bacterium]
MADDSMTFDPRAVSTGAPASGISNDKEISDEMFRLLVSSVKDYAIFMLDTEGHVMTWNEGAERIKGYAPDEIIGKHFRTFYEQDAVESRHPEHELELAASTGRYEEEGWRLRKDGSLFWANVVITALRNEKGTLIGFSKVTRDLTERKQAEQLREETLRLINESNEELQRLAYVVSHELQAPIYTIARYCNLLSARYRDRLGADANEFIDKITSSSALVARMVDDIWVYARVARPNIERETVYIGRVLDDALAELHADSGNCDVIRGELPSLPGNRSQLVYLFKELVSNAIKYRSEEKPRIHIGCSEEDGGFLFEIEDNGIGIDSVYKNDVFKLFHRLDGGPDAESTGMGLAICKKIVTQHNGKIWLQPQEKGAKFCVWLPAR